MNRYLLLLVSVFSLPVLAEPLAHLPVSPAQRTALGIQLADVVPTDGYPTAALAARVVAAGEAHWQITTPLAGQVRQVQPVGTVLAAGDSVALVASASLMQLGSDYAEAQSQLEQATAAQVRMEALYQDGSTARKHYEQAQRDVRVAKARQAALQNRLDLLNIAPEEAVAGELRLTAPFAGRVSVRHAMTGSNVDAAMPLVEIINPQALELELHWPLGRGPVPGVGASFVTADAIHARVVAESPHSAQGRQSVLLRLGVIEGSAQLRPGQWLWLQPQPQAAAMAVPRNAVIRNAGQAVVFAETAEGFAVIPVRIHGENAGLRYVSGELAPGTRVAETGAIALKGLWLGHGGE